MIVSPKNVHHAALQAEVVSYLESLGFIVEVGGASDILPSAFVRAMQRVNEPTSVYVRSFADILAVHPLRGVTIMAEAKSHLAPERHDLLVEAWPLLCRSALGDLGVRTLYAYDNPYNHHSCGFWAGDLPPLREVRIPERLSLTIGSDVSRAARLRWPGVKVIPSRSRGSGDPFVVIDETVVDTLPDWRQLVDGSIGWD